MAVEQIEQLRLQRRAGTPRVEIDEERILGFFQHSCGVEPRRQPLGERRLARADRAFNRDVLERHSSSAAPGRPAAACYHPAFGDGDSKAPGQGPTFKARRRSPRTRALSLALCALCLGAAWVVRRRRHRAPSAPPATPVAPPEITWEEKLGWIIRLEDQRLLRDPNPPPPRIIVPATADHSRRHCAPAAFGPDSVAGDGEARTRRRAALAVGRVGLREGVEPLAGLLTDPDPEVRQMAAFALGLIGNSAARPALIAALNDADAMVQGRAAEALGNIGAREDAAAIAAMTQAHIKAGAFTGIAADDLQYPITPAAEAARLGLYALVRLNDFDAVVATALDAAGQPVSNWWPVAYALQRPGDSPRRATAAGAAQHSWPLHGRFRRARPGRDQGARGSGPIAADRRPAAGASGSGHPGDPLARRHRRHGGPTFVRNDRPRCEGRSAAPARGDEQLCPAGDGREGRSAAGPHLRSGAGHPWRRDADAGAARTPRHSWARSQGSTSTATGPCALPRPRRSQRFRRS